MYVERVDIDGFRNCCESVAFDARLTLLLGENNAGKTNIIDALRLVLPADAGTDRLRPRAADFARKGDGTRLSDEFTVTAVLAGLNAKEQGLAANALAPQTEGPGKARIGIHASLQNDEDVRWQRFGGDLDWTEMEQRPLATVCYTYLPPLRDAASDLQPGRSNRLARLLQTVAPDQTDRERLVALVKDANDGLRKDPKVERAVELVQGVLDAMTRAGHRQKSDVAFAELDFPSLTSRLLGLLGEEAPRALVESGLGYQNLLYMSVLLAHLSEVAPPPLRVLLVEEPEAHLHPQLQDLLLQYLQGSEGATGGRQAVLTSNSPQFASAADLDRLVVIARPRGQDRSTGHPVRDIDMSPEQRAHVRRFLDVTKASLFFARGVMLVEGVSEQLLMPYFARILDKDLADAGVSVINIGGVAFSHFAALFGDGGLPIRCAIVTDGDPDADPTDPDNPDLTRSPRAEAALKLKGGNVDVFVADVTLEWDLAHAQPRADLLTKTMTTLHPKSGPEVAAMATLSANAWAFKFRKKLTRKAEFAQELAAALDEDASKTLVVPGYLQRAIEHVTGQAQAEVDGGADPA